MRTVSRSFKNAVILICNATLFTPKLGAARNSGAFACEFQSGRSLRNMNSLIFLETLKYVAST